MIQPIYAASGHNWTITAGEDGDRCVCEVVLHSYMRMQGHGATVREAMLHAAGVANRTGLTAGREVARRILGDVGPASTGEEA